LYQKGCEQKSEITLYYKTDNANFF